MESTTGPAEPWSAAPVVLLVDDDALFREAAALTLRDAGYRVVTAESAASGSEELADTDVDVVLADIGMDGNHRLEWLAQIEQAAPGVPVVIVTGQPSMETAIEAVRLPVVAYLVKPVDARALCDGVSRALASRAPRTEVVLQRLVARRQREWELSNRQAEVLALLVGGASNKQIAAALGCAPRTAELHVSALLEKSGQPSRAALVAMFWTQTGA